MIYAFLYAYSFELANSAVGGLEDEINKPDRPITSNVTTLTATKIRYLISVGVWLAYSHFLDVQRWTLLWLFTFVGSHTFHLANVWPGKDLGMFLGAIAQLMASWEFGGSDIEVGWSWVKIIIIWVFFTSSIQDLRDVPGDTACGRQTTPIFLGDNLGMFL